MKREIITPRTLRGFADTLPNVGQHRRRIIQTIEETFCSFGFDPIQTPNLEYAEILKGKGGGDSDKQMFEFDDQGGRRVALRFDLTVPLARFVAQHEAKLPMPLRAYNIGYVWRGDRPQKGRYREFLQCDADIIGESDVAADAELLTMAQVALDQIDIGQFAIRVNNRHVVNGLLADLDLGDRATPVLRALDKIDKVGPDGVAAELAEVDVAGAAVERILALVGCRGENNAETLATAAELILDEEGKAGLAEVHQTLELIEAFGGDSRRLRFDPSIVRGLDYYTGMVYEIAHLEVPEVGSIGGGGRYDNLTGLYTKSRLPGVGGTIGVSRLMAALESLGGFEREVRERPLVLITRSGGDRLLAEARAASVVRDTGRFDVDVYPADLKHAVQMKYADRRSARFVLTMDDATTVSVKDMVSGDRFAAGVDQLPEVLQKQAGQGFPE